MESNVADAEVDGKRGFFGRLKAGLGKTRAKFSEGIADVFLGEKTLDEGLLEELETILLTSDVGVSATEDILSHLTTKIGRKEINDVQAVYNCLKAELVQILEPVEVPLVVTGDPFVILMVGVNGVGKTTTIGKLARRYKSEGKSVMLAAGDTFRAAAVEQLKAWGDKNDVPVVAQASGADSASVIYDAYAAARARGVDVLIADTAGRLQNKKNLMDELGKITRVLSKIDDSAPHEVLLVLDAGTGQNAISQAKEFQETVALQNFSASNHNESA